MSRSITPSPPLSQPPLCGVSRPLPRHPSATKRPPGASDLGGAQRRRDLLRSFPIQQRGGNTSALKLGDRNETKEPIATTS